MFANEQDHHHGTGGYSQYNRDQMTRTWDDAMANELEITVDRKRELCEAIRSARQAAAVTAPTAVAIDSVDDSSESDVDLLTIAVSAVLTPC